MHLDLEIPDDLAGRLGAPGIDLSRRALEAFLAEEYKQDRITKRELRQLLSIETSYDLDGFLKAHDIWIEYTREDAHREAAMLERLIPAETSAAAAPQPSPKPRRISERIAAIMSDVPREEFAKLPKDGARQVDHYVYGLPKRD